MLISRGWHILNQRGIAWQSEVFSQNRPRFTLNVEESSKKIVGQNEINFLFQEIGQEQNSNWKCRFASAQSTHCWGAGGCYHGGVQVIIVIIMHQKSIVIFAIKMILSLLSTPSLLLWASYYITKLTCVKLVHKTVSNFLHRSGWAERAERVSLE